MSLVVTLLAAPGAQGPLSDALSDLSWALTEAGAALGRPDWLQPGRACDLTFEGVALDAARDLAGRSLAGQAVDFHVQPPAGRRKALLLADMESTIIGQEMLDEMAEMIGRREAVAAVTARAMAGELDFRAALEERVALFAGQPASLLDRVADRMTLNPGAAALIEGLRERGIHTALVSGGFTCFAEPVAETCGFDQVFANRLEVVDGTLTGRVQEPLLDRDAKRIALEELCAERQLGSEAVCTVGDGANDVAMLEAAGLGVAYRGKPPARAAADVSLDHGELDGICALMGLRDGG